MLSQNPFDQFDSAPADPGFTGVIPGVPKPKDPKSPEFVPQKATQLFDPNTNTYSPVPQAPPDAESAQKQAAAKQSAEEAADQLIQGIHRARALVSNWSTGAGANLKDLPISTDASKLDAIINQEIRGNVFLSRINMLREENDSPNGGTGIGRIMQAEIPLITGSLGTLDPRSLGRQGTLDSLTEIEARTLRTKAILNGENPDDPAVIKKYNIPAMPKFGAVAAPGGSGGDGGSGGGGGGDTPPGISDLSGDQKNAYDAFLAANPQPSGSQVSAFLTKLTGKTVTNGDDIAKAIAQGRGSSTTVQDLTEQQKVKDRIGQENKAGLGEDPLTTVVKQGATLNLSDEAAGVGNAAANAVTSPFTGKFDPVGSYRLGRDTERQRVTDARNALGWAAAPVEFVGGMASGSPTNALAALQDVPSLMRMGAKGGAVGGAVAGFGSGEGAQQSIANAAVGGTAGAAVGAVAPYVANRISANNAARALAPDVADAAQAEGVDLLRPMVDPSVRGKFGALESAPGSQGVIRSAVDKTKGQIEGRVTALGQNGTALDTGAAGERVQDAARRFIQRTRGVADRLYNRARSLAGDTRFVPQKAIGAVDDQIANLSANPQTNAGEIKFLQGLKGDLSTDGGKSVEELRGLRQSVRGRINEQGLTSTQAEARAMSVLDAAQQDASANLPKGAADSYRRADTFYRERMVHVDDVLDRFLGGNVQQGQARLSGEQAFQRLKNMASPGGDGRRLSAMMRDLEPSERQDISATIAGSLGRRSPDEPFSTDLFLSQTNKLAPSARKIIFGPDGAQSIDNLRLLSQKLKEGVGDINKSRTANSMWRLMAGRMVGSLTGLGGTAGLVEGGLHGGATGMATGAVVGAAVKGAQVARNVLSARALVNPRVSQWLAQAATVSTPSQATQAVRGLSLIISREPSLAHELTPVRDFLNQRVTQLLAAEPSNPQDGNNE